MFLPGGTMKAQSVLIFPLILILLGICGPANQVVTNQTQSVAPLNLTVNATSNTTVVPPQNATPSNTTQANLTQEDLQVWNGITTPRVEAACLNESETEAGSLAWAVQGCTCQETLGSGVKNYSCTVSTVEGDIPAQVSCVLAASTCSLTSSYGNGSLTFAQIQAELGSGGN
jgi:hypothetical protein